MSVRVLLIALSASVISVVQSQAAVLTVNGSGQLTGATGIDVGGTLFDVLFSSQPCASVYGGCDSTSDFDFLTEADARLAAQALLDQVFIDGPSGNFDSDPTLTFGCSSTFSCAAYIPFGFNQFSTDDISIATAANLNSAFMNEVTSGPFFGGPNFTLGPNFIWADFTLSTVSEVPLPAAFPLFLMGLTGIGLFKRQKSTGNAGVVLS